MRNSATAFRTGQNFRMRVILFSLWLLASRVAADEAWTTPLAGMPLGSDARQLTRTNCVEVMLEAFRSNAVVKALIFMPGATDELYMFKRVNVTVTNPSPSLLDAVVALTNQSHIRASFTTPFLLLHTEEDVPAADVVAGDDPSTTRLKHLHLIAHLVCNDRDWDFLQPLLKRALKLDVRPWHGSRDSWHFYRHSFAAWNLTGWEAIEVAALSGKARCSLRRGQALFEVDRRVGAPPRLEDLNGAHSGTGQGLKPADGR